MKRMGLVAALLVGMIASLGFASRMWTSVLHFDPGFVFAHAPVPTGAPLSTSVTILLIDGLRLDASRRMPELNALRVQGASIEAIVGTPSFSRPGRATLVVGAPPDIHGVTSNRQKRAIPLDSLIRRVGASGGACRIAGSKIWSGLFSEDIARCGAYLEGEGKEGPGMFVRQVPEIRQAQEQGIVFVLQEPAMLRIADVISTDFAAHEYGGASAEYAAEVLRADALIAVVAARLDLTRETLVVTADHGHRDSGGHGGDEPEVLSIPIVMAGAGIRSSVNLSARQEDLAPTIAALLGIGLPTAAAGRVIEAALLADDTKLAMIKGAGAMQKVAFDRGIARRLGTVEGDLAGSDWRTLISDQNRRTRRERTPFALLVSTLGLIVTGAAIWCARPDPRALIAGGAGLAVTLVLLLVPKMPAMSFSSINYDEMLIPFFVRVMVLAALATLVSVLSTLVFGVFGKPVALDRAITSASAMGLLVSGIPGLTLIAKWWSEPLLQPATLPGPDEMVAAYSLTLSLLSATVTTLMFLAAVRTIEGFRAGRNRTVQGTT